MVPKGTNFTLNNVLYRQRILFLLDELDSELSNQIVGLIVFLSIEDHTKDQHLLILCPGGSIIGGVAIYDMMQSVKADVHTVAVGEVASIASFILLGGTITKRLAFPHAWRQWDFYLKEKRRLCLRHMKYEY
nr:clp protease proteolytic subunit [Dipelta elegans]UZZ45312.1 clp protease proteolytic subunit [Dipelta yunnanensis]UZZ45486.1 clp protease proteolytic subunit [Dipelta floribunda]UZZ45225.1 clp protease proteolytic subunit [Dipelta elegans]UZZ45399.1 clp protease proteolytic subunit [Dipelta yunnanensis]